GKASSRRRSTESCAGRTATPGRCKACTPRARRSSGALRPLSCAWSASPSRWPRSRGAREVATGVPCSSWHGARSSAASSTMPSPGARATMSPAPWPGGLAGPDGRPIALQLLDRRPGHERLDAARHYPDQDEVDRVRVALRLPAVPGLGVRCAALTPGATRPDRAGDGAVVKGRSLVNHWIEIVLEPTGALALHDRRTGERFFDVLRLEDGGDAGDTYSYCPPVRDRSVRAAGPIKVRRLAAGPLVASLEATFTMRVGDGVTEQRRANSVTRRRPGQV